MLSTLQKKTIITFTLCLNIINLQAMKINSPTYRQRIQPTTSPQFRLAATENNVQKTNHNNYTSTWFEKPKTDKDFHTRMVYIHDKK